MQKYEYSPGSFGIVIGLLDCPGEIRLVSNLPSGVASLPEVAVCIAVSSFFQVIVLPGLAADCGGTEFLIITILSTFSYSNCCRRRCWGSG